LEEGLIWKRIRERRVLTVHEAPYQHAEWAVGEVLQHEGRLYEVTRWVELPPVSLARGGSVGEWEIWGIELSDKETRERLLRETERFLRGEGNGGAAD
jgi:hypothetical protein